MTPKSAFLFPGQGSQSAGMLAGLTASEAVVAETFEEASERLGYDMARLVSENPDDRLNRTEYTQPALLTASTALLRLWLSKGGKHADHVAGHSLGEYSALVAAGSLAFDDAVELVAFRGKAMTEAVPAGKGAMAAILGLADEQVQALCVEASQGDEKVWPANYNCPGQLVAAGHAAAVGRLMDRAREAGARRALPLPVSAPSHTPLMRPAADALKKRLHDVQVNDPDRPVWSNALAAPVEEADAIRQALVDQLVSPVRWTEIIQHMRNIGVMRGVEMGPGKVLAGLTRRIDRTFTVCLTDSPANMAESIEMMAGGNV